MSNLTIENGGLVIQTKYDADFVAGLKSLIPATERKFDPRHKTWVVNPVYSDQVAKLIQQCFGELVLVQKPAQVNPLVELKILEIHYIGQTKDRQGAADRSAFGMDQHGEWSAIFPEPVLRTWFCDNQARPGEKTSLYSILGMQNSSTSDELKSAYRRLSKQWHPDVCSEPDAAEQFMRITSAYELLSDPGKRARYDAGLTFEASLAHAPFSRMSELTTGYRAPLRCGMILAEGITVIGRFMVNKILAWDDIADARGRVLVSSWPMGATKPVEVWA